MDLTNTATTLCRQPSAMPPSSCSTPQLHPPQWVTLVRCLLLQDQGLSNHVIDILISNPTIVLPFPTFPWPDVNPGQLPTFIIPTPDDDQADKLVIQAQFDDWRQAFQFDYSGSDVSKSNPDSWRGVGEGLGRGQGVLSVAPLCCFKQVLCILLIDSYQQPWSPLSARSKPSSPSTLIPECPIGPQPTRWL